MQHRIKTLAVTAALAFGAAVMPTPAAAAVTTLYAPTPAADTRLVTNEYAYWNQGARDAVQSPDWQMDSGSLFTRPTAEGPAYWSGPVNDRVPDGDSNPGTNSAIFRLTTKRADFGDVQVRMKLLINSQTATRSTPVVDWDGLHIFLRYQHEASLYYVSVARRDGAIVAKKKCPGGPSNGGTYYTLGTGAVKYKPTPGQWKWYSANVQNNKDGSVTIGVNRADVPVFSITDKGTGCAPITKPGRVGLRGDNTDFNFSNYKVSTLS
ncbi:hypothetical protein GCM10010124_13460 [Pilimelia terevasa]|uniref:Uncharacterized protein n=1 Tax=Pilimelia terevasa TaxID=53372 RepID=A0A8J3BIQ1_9ACTN|nr:hypothetical protein [Pilimelia terevasa]GGK22287.1 hypothetical protein GCM10010124_13460 [Pilimelia terevasa]